ncbi:hypothetical protein CCAX7_55310 [Capsulimonas corticalis]|uniref:Uncharacterized protein n=1 Tax=Capsulimonas corticalis TaxID=2219043 RepID=A0A402D5J8_9BACT|nr:hypothetical protein [Capsulimonas corticalis]BDI33480.1 hypothetical protein CCAX7_55310 [Capsulimonas corticalis]
MDDFVVGVLAGTLMGLLLLRSRRVAGEAPAEADEAETQGPKLELVETAEPDAYEDPGKVERQQQLERYRRLLREEFGVDHAGSLVDPMTGEEAATHG